MPVNQAKKKRTTMTHEPQIPLKRILKKEFKQ